MKQIYLILFGMICLLGLQACQRGGQDFFDDDLPAVSYSASTKGLAGSVEVSNMPLNVVPQWVKNKVTPEEYRMWQFISTKFEVNYAFLLDSMSANRRTEVFNHLQRLCEEIKEGRYDDLESPMIFTVASEPQANKLLANRIEKLSSYESDQLGSGEEVRSKTMDVCTSKDWPDMKLQVTVTYIYNRNAKTCRNVQSSTAVAGPHSNIQMTFSGGSSVAFSSESGKLQGAVSGNFSYNAQGGRMTEPTIQNQQFLITP